MMESTLTRLLIPFSILLFLLGIGSTAILTLQPSHLLFVSGIYLLLFAILGLVLHRWFHYLLILLFFSAGYLYTQFMTPHPSSSDLVRYVGQGKIHLTGAIADEPLYQENNVKFTFQVESAGTDHFEPSQGKTLVTLKNPSETPLRYGQKLELEGIVTRPKASRNPGDFSYRDYLSRQGIFSLFTVNSGQDLSLLDKKENPILATALWAKHRIMDGHGRALSKPYDSLLGSIVLGSRASPIPQEMQQSFRNIGLGHLLAVSGFQIAIILGVCLSLGALFQFSKGWIIGYTVPLLLFYTLMTGAPPSVTRATLMALIGLIGFYLNREKNLLSIAALSGFLLLLYNPLWFFDVGFQFSYLATFGLIYLAEPIASRLIFLPRIFASLLGVVLASQIVILPLQFYYFNQFSWVALPANLVAALLIFGITIIGFLSSLMALIQPFLAFPLDWLLLGLMILLVKMVDFFKELPGALAYVPTPPLWLILSYYGTILVLLEGIRQGFLHINKEKWLIFGLFFLASYLWLPQVYLDKSLTVTFFDVGEGDATLVETPQGQTILIDAGTRSEYRGTLYDMGERVILPYLHRKGINHLDMAIATHSDLDHLGGFISLLDKIQVNQILDSGQTDPDKGYQLFLRKVGTKNIPLIPAEEGMKILLGPDLFLEILNPHYPFYSDTRSDINANAVLFRLIYKDQPIFFSSDMEEVNEKYLLDSGLDLHSTLLKVAHHGSRYSSSLPFLEKVKPDMAIISVGRNLYGHPHNETLSRLEAVGATIFRTDELGAIVIRFREGRPQVEVMN